MSDLQKKVMVFIVTWVKTEKVPVPKQEIFKAMVLEGIKEYTTESVLDCLLRKRYIRRAHSRTTKVSYVQLRSI